MSILRRPPAISSVFFPQSTKISWKMSFVGQVLCILKVTVACAAARDAEVSPTPAAKAPAAAPSNPRRDTAFGRREILPLLSLIMITPPQVKRSVRRGTKAIAQGWREPLATIPPDGHPRTPDVAHPA